MDKWIVPILVAIIVGSTPGVLAWIRGRRKDSADTKKTDADTASVLVDTSSDVVVILRAELDRAVVNIDRLTRQIVGMQERIVNFERERQKYEDTLADFVIAIESMRNRNEMQEKEIVALKARIVSLEYERDALRRSTDWTACGKVPQHFQLDSNEIAT
jgi:chromosome segregation ATPase